CLAPPILRQVLDLGRLQVDQVGVIDDELDGGASKLTQDRIFRRLDVGTGQVEVQGCRPAVESRLQEFEFAAEVVVDAGSCDADSGTDVVQADAGETPDGEHANGLGEQCFPPGAAPYGGVRGSGGAREVGGGTSAYMIRSSSSASRGEAPRWSRLLGLSGAPSYLRFPQGAAAMPRRPPPAI